MKNILIVGAGQLGSRHLQALKKNKESLNILVVDPNNTSLKTAKERYALMHTTGANHRLKYLKNLNKLPTKIDLTIIATNSDVRFKVLKELFDKTKIKYLVLEKLLFSNKAEHLKSVELVKKNNCRAWVNCSMRMVPFYRKLREKFRSGGPINLQVTGSQFGLVTNTIHYLDFVAFLTDCYDYKINTDYLDIKTIASKRKGFFELNGCLIAKYRDKSMAFIQCYSEGTSPLQIKITNSQLTFIFFQNEQKGYLMSCDTGWKRSLVPVRIPYQSELTTILTEEILRQGTCGLTELKDAVQLHLPLLEGLKRFLNMSSNKKINHYPFT